jgi:putative membrane protein
MADQEKDELARERTDFAEDRTVLANERTFAGWLRTGYAGIGIRIGV